MSPTICIISFSPIARDARVLRQIAALAPQYNLLVVGYDLPPPRWRDAANVRWFTLEPLRWYEWLYRAGFLLAGRVLRLTVFYELWYWLNRLHRQAFNLVRFLNADLLIANDWHALPLAWRLAVHWNAPLILDLHEYAPLEWEEQWQWRLHAGQVKTLPSPTRHNRTAFAHLARSHCLPSHALVRYLPHRAATAWGAYA